MALAITGRACGWALVVALATAVASAPAPAFADAGASEVAFDRRAEGIKERGDAAMEAGRYADALAAYKEAYTAAPQPALLYNIGRAEERLGLYPEALRSVEQFARTAPPAFREKVPRLGDLLTELRSHVAFVTIHANVDGAKVMLRGRYVASTPSRWALTTTPGDATFEVSADGYAPWHRDVVLEESKTTSLDVTLVPRGAHFMPAKVAASNKAARVFPPEGAAGGAAGVGGHDVKSADKTTGGVSTKWWFWTGIGVGVMGGVALTAALVSERSGSRGEVASGRTSGALGAGDGRARARSV